MNPILKKRAIPNLKLFTFLLSLLIIACQFSPNMIPGVLPDPFQAGTPAENTQLAISNKQRVTSPQISEEDLQTLAQDNNAFALDLYHVLTAKSAQNLVISPYSVSQALAMTYAGAGGQTARQMEQVLYFNLPAERLHPAFNALDLSLNTPAGNLKADSFQLNIANSLWGQTGFPFLPDFLNLLAENYGSGIRLTNFSSAPDASRQSINQWVSQQTQNKINNLLAKADITSQTRLALVNAIYFHGRWTYPFGHTSTHPVDFTRLDGSNVSVPMMFSTPNLELAYTDGEGYQAAELPYIGDQVAMTVIVPDSDQFGTIQKSLSAAWLAEIWSQMQPLKVTLGLPKFKYETSLRLNDTLDQMGMQDAFNATAADFSGIDGRRDLYIGAVVHKAMVAVDEDGTEAAAATAVVAKPGAARSTGGELFIDRPFFFVIHDVQNYAILFIGQVVDPLK